MIGKKKQELGRCAKLMGWAALMGAVMALMCRFFVLGYLAEEQGDDVRALAFTAAYLALFVFTCVQLARGFTARGELRRQRVRFHSYEWYSMTGWAIAQELKDAEESGREVVIYDPNGKIEEEEDRFRASLQAIEEGHDATEAMRTGQQATTEG